jgi:hypothetical protein
LDRVNYEAFKNKSIEQLWEIDYQINERVLLLDCWNSLLSSLLSEINVKNNGIIDTYNSKVNNYNRSIHIFPTFLFLENYMREDFVYYDLNFGESNKQIRLMKLRQQHWVETGVWLNYSKFDTL